MTEDNPINDYYNAEYSFYPWTYDCQPQVTTNNNNPNQRDHCTMIPKPGITDCQTQAMNDYQSCWNSIYSTSSCDAGANNKLTWCGEYDSGTIAPPPPPPVPPPSTTCLPLDFSAESKKSSSNYCTVL